MGADYNRTHSIKKRKYPPEPCRCEIARTDKVFLYRTIIQYSYFLSVSDKNTAYRDNLSSAWLSVLKRRDACPKRPLEKNACPEGYISVAVR